MIFKFIISFCLLSIAVSLIVFPVIFLGMFKNYKNTVIRYIKEKEDEI